MSAGAVARRYARALYELASEAEKVDEIEPQLKALAEAVSGLDAELLAPGALSAQVRDTLGGKLAASFGDGSVFARFVRVVAAADRLAEIPRIADWFSRMRDAAGGVVRASVRAAAPLSEENQRSLESIFSKLVGKRVVPEIEIDDNLLGGLVVEIEGRVYDGSLRSGLKRLGESMARGSTRSGQ